LERKTVLLKHTIRASTDEALIVDGLEKRICLDVSDPEMFRAIDFPADIYDLLKGAKGEQP
jgi:hypothetical protein